MKRVFLWMGMAVMAAALALVFGCGSPNSDSPTSLVTDRQTKAGEFLVTVDLDNAKLTIEEPIRPAWTGVINGHTIEIKNGPAGCVWNSGTYTMTCEILFRNLDSNECMTNVRTRLSASTNPTAIMDQVDYNWVVPGVSYNLVPNTAQPINNTGYCITDDSPNLAGSAEGCANTWQDNIPSGAIATQKFVFTNVTSGGYSFLLTIFADYMSCSAPAGMKRVPAGCFAMGFTPPGTNTCIASDFALDEHEVTNAEYRNCVDAGYCGSWGYESPTRPDYFSNSAYDNYPVLGLYPGDAYNYCAWAGKRMPTVTEFEYAARGGLDSQDFPWGMAIPTPALANYSSPDTTPVKSFPANGYGLYDLAGNAYDMVLNESDSPFICGGSYATTSSYLRVFACVDVYDWMFWSQDAGFRCAQDAAPMIDETAVMNAVNCTGAGYTTAFYDDFEAFNTADWSYWSTKGVETTEQAHSGTHSILLTGPTWSEIYRAYIGPKTGKVAVSGWWYMPDGVPNHRLILSDPIRPWAALRGAGAAYDSVFEDYTYGVGQGPINSWHESWGWHFIMVMLDFDNNWADMYAGTGPGNVRLLIQHHPINASYINAMGLDSGYNYNSKYYADDLRVCDLP